MTMMKNLFLIVYLTKESKLYKSLHLQRKQFQVYFIPEARPGTPSRGIIGQLK